MKFSDKGIVQKDCFLVSFIVVLIQGLFLQRIINSSLYDIFTLLIKKNQSVWWFLDKRTLTIFQKKTNR